MAMLGLLDLSIVTDRLIARLNDCARDSQLWREEGTNRFVIHYTGLAPEAVRKSTEGGCQVSVYLFHVAADKFHRNTFPTGGSAQLTPQQPLGLVLYYLLSAYSPSSYIEEQQAMSIALKCFHEHPVVTATVPIDDRVEEFTVTMEAQTVDEVGRLWQAMATPMRLSAVYRASVVFLEPRPLTVPPVVLAVPVPVVEPLAGAPPERIFPVGLDGLATVTIEDAGFATGTTEVLIRSLALAETTTHDPPDPGEFRIADETNLVLCPPTATPPGRYLLHITPAPWPPPRDVWLVVP